MFFVIKYKIQNSNQNITMKCLLTSGLVQRALFHDVPDMPILTYGDI